MTNTANDPTDPEDLLCQSWSIGRLRPWLQIVAKRELPHRLRGRVEPSDIVQQTLLKAWQGEANFRGETHEQRLAWLRVIIKNTIRDRYRALLDTQCRGNGIEQAASDAFPPEASGLNNHPAHETPTASGVLIAAEESLALAAALEKLPEEQRRVIHLRHFDNLNYAEIAKRLNKSESAVRMLWVRALRGLRD